MPARVLDDDDRSIILASGSPRRRELLERMGFVPLVHKSSVPEAPEPGEAPGAYTERLALSKARAVEQNLRDRDDLPAWILAADTVVVLEDQILEKPTSGDHARTMLQNLSGRTHQVLTSFCWLCRGADGPAAHVETAATLVRFRDLDDGTIARYVATGEPMDKAGAYGIQGLGGALVEGIEGDYDTVVGLPVAQVIATLRALGGLQAFPFLPGPAGDQASAHRSQER